MLGRNQEKNSNTEDVTCEEALKMIKENENNPNFVILDVRTPEEYAEDHFEGSKNVDYNSPDFINKLEGMDKNSTYIVYCRSGVRSRNAANSMSKVGYSKIYNVLGGIMDCKAKGVKVVR
ncbi:rhodanese-like domain-containing protein [Methanobacterium aggregans]|uniref:rhodanese-like domain-containing protein n=1 Tax=Methanobacterium aggregans TaxID=1615586 RepID=UPI001AE81417|nr:rhodanese-like domain-containing protein [Methanobacterium aggregans]MBP2046948.1 rhodanese-related sulfurtransferase [Methanobacterium aggregans]